MVHGFVKQCLHAHLRSIRTPALAEGKYGARTRTGVVLGLTSESRLKAIADEGAPEPWTSRQGLDNASVLSYNIDEYTTSKLNKPIPVTTRSCETGAE